MKFDWFRRKPQKSSENNFSSLNGIGRKASNNVSFLLARRKFLFKFLYFLQVNFSQIDALFNQLNQK